jgi:Bifunctional DNA primase/polymerase, N-terminal/AAA domain
MRDNYHDTSVVSNLAPAALAYAQRGWHVLPCDPQTKRPLIKRGLHAATLDPQQIEAWWQQWPCALIGIRTGPESGLWVLDVDICPDEGIDGFVSITTLERQHGALPNTLTSATPRGGFHLFFKWHPGIRNNADGKLGAHLDVRGENGYVIVPPSMRWDRKCYGWRENCPAEPTEAPTWLIELLTASAATPAPTNGNASYNNSGNGYAHAALAREIDAVASAPVGRGNHTLNRAAFNLGQLIGGGALSEAEVQNRLFEAATACGLVADDGADAVRKTIASGLTAGMKQPRSIPERAAPSPTVIKPETVAAVMAAGAAAPQQAATIITSPPAPAPISSTPTISASPFVWHDPVNIPPRAWLYGRHYIRQFLTCTIAPGGHGKTSLAIVEALAMASGRPLLGIAPSERARVWIWNGEDPMDELNRRITAAMLHHQIAPEQIEGYLFRNTGRETPITLATQTRSGTTVDQAVVTILIETIRQNQIDVLIVDPFVKSHKVTENDNVAIDLIATQCAQIADLTNCAVELLHHPKKTGGGEIGVEDARGAVSLTNAARSVRLLNKMTKQEAEDAGIEDAWRYFRIDNGKANMAPPPEKADWYKLASITLDNGDNVGAVTAWTWPNPFEGVTAQDLRAAQKEVSEGGPWRVNSQADNWIGKPVAKALKLDAYKDKDRPPDRQGLRRRPALVRRASRRHHPATGYGRGRICPPHPGSARRVLLRRPSRDTLPGGIWH